MFSRRPVLWGRNISFDHCEDWFFPAEDRIDLQREDNLHNKDSDDLHCEVDYYRAKMAMSTSGKAKCNPLGFICHPWICLNKSFRSEISIIFWNFFIPLKTYFGNKKISVLEGTLIFLTRKYEIRIIKDENSKKCIYHFGFRISIPIKKCMYDVQLYKSLYSYVGTHPHPPQPPISMPLLP